MTEIAEVVLDTAIENADDIAEVLVETVEIVKYSWPACGAAFIGGLAIGAGVGYFVAAKRVAKKFDEQMAKEVADTREFFAALNKVDPSGEPISPRKVMEERHGVEAAAAAARRYQGRIEDPDDEPVLEGEPHDEIVDEEQIEKLEKRAREERESSVNVFRDDQFDLEEEIKLRTEDAPYIITHDEFFAAEKDYDTQSLTYYEKDDTLVDERDAPLPEIDNLVGDENLVRFGSGSKDKNIVYIRNDKLQIDYEITRSTGSYVVEVLGMKDEDDSSLKHSDNQRDRRRRFLNGDG